MNNQHKTNISTTSLSKKVTPSGAEWAPLVSIIIPTYNRAHLIGETLDSVLAQTYQNWECIIVDDGSSDNTDEVVGAYVEKDSRFKYFHRPEEHLPGGNGARNFGFKISKGEYVNWFDSDDLMHPQKLEIQLRLLKETNKNFCVCQTMVFEGTVDNQLGLRKPNIISEDPFNDFVQSKIKWLTQAPIVKSDFLKNNNLIFLETLKRAQEYDFFSRLLYLDIDYCFTNKALVYLRSHEVQISSETYNSEKNFSVFRASLSILKSSSYKLNKNSEIILINNLFNRLFIALSHKDFKSFRKMLENLDKSIVSLKERCLLKLAFYSYFFFGKGYFFYNRLKY